MRNTTAKALDLPKVNARKCLLGWFIVEAYLDGLEASASELFGDLEYKKLFDSLRVYSNKQIYGNKEFNMVDVDVIVYQDD